MSLFSVASPGWGRPCCLTRAGWGCSRCAGRRAGARRWRRRVRPGSGAWRGPCSAIAPSRSARPWAGPGPERGRLGRPLADAVAWRKSASLSQVSTSEFADRHRPFPASLFTSAGAVYRPLGARDAGTVHTRFVQCHCAPTASSSGTARTGLRDARWCGRHLRRLSCHCPRRATQIRIVCPRPTPGPPRMPGPMGRDQLATPRVRRLRGAALGGEFDVHKADSLSQPLSPSNTLSSHAVAMPTSKPAVRSATCSPYRARTRRTEREPAHHPRRRHRCL